MTTASLPALAASLLVFLATLPAAIAADNPAQPVTVIASEYQFSPNKLRFSRGVAYRLHFENHGKETHEFTAPKFFRAVEAGANPPLNPDKTEIVVQPGEAKDFTFVPKKGGRFPLRCADHDWAGMTGEIIVK